jgi:hypothetical protein
MDLLSCLKEHFHEVEKEISPDFGGDAAFSSPVIKPKNIADTLNLESYSPK